MWFAMARSGSLPSVLTKVHPVYKTPVNTIILQWIVNLVTGVGLTLWLGAVNGYGFESFVLVLAVLIVYAMGNLGVFLLYWRQYRSEFNIFYHAVFPILSTLALIWLGYELFNPFPTVPLVWALPTIAIWFLIGVGILFVMRARGKEEWLTRAGESAFEVPETPESTEPAHGRA